MKKKIIVLLLASFLLIGCTKNSVTYKSYKSVNEYEKAMTSVKNNFPAFSFEGHQYNRASDSKFKAYIKNNLIRQDLPSYLPFMTASCSYTPNGIFMGKERIPLDAKPKTKEFYKLMIAYKLTSWNSPEFQKDVTEKAFTSKDAYVNNIRCRMIHYKKGTTSEVDVCVNDEYGVAVYYEEDGIRFNKPFHDRIEVSKIKTDNIPNKFFYDTKAW